MRKCMTITLDKIFKKDSKVAMESLVIFIYHPKAEQIKIFITCVNQILVIHYGLLI